MRSTKWHWLGLVGVLAVFAGCGQGGSGGGGGDLSGSIRVDGSSTVAPLSEPVGALFSQEQPGVRTTVGTSGTGGGFEKFCRGETDISDASREISDEEREACRENGVEFGEIAVANDALTVVVNPENPVDCLSVDQLNQIFDPESTITNWSQIDGLEPRFDAPLEIFTPGADSGTFDFFTEAVNDEEGAQRTRDVNIVGEDDNATVRGVTGSRGGIGYFGYSFFNENREQLKALAIENPETGQCVPPAEQTVQSGTYTPLGRELYIYPSAQALQRPEVRQFVSFYLENINSITSRVGFIPLTEEQLADARAKVERLVQRGGGSGSGGGG